MVEKGFRRVGVFWDVENCGIPLEMPGSIAADRIRSAVKHFGELIELNAYGDLSLFKLSTKVRGLRNAGVCFVDTPHESRKQVADMRIIADIVAFALDQIEPSTVILISCDGDFAHAISLIQDRGHAVWVISNTLSTSKKLHFLADGMMSWKYDVLDRIYPFTDSTCISPYTDDEDECEENDKVCYSANAFSAGFDRPLLCSSNQAISSCQTSSYSFCATTRPLTVQTCFSPVDQQALVQQRGHPPVHPSSPVLRPGNSLPISPPSMLTTTKHPPEWQFFPLIKFLRERRAADPENRIHSQRCEIANILRKRDASIFASYKTSKAYFSAAADAGVIIYVRDIVAGGKRRFVYLHPDYY